MSEFKFSIPIAVRIDDINFSGHVGYQIYLLYFQEARIAYLKNFGFAERDIAGFGMVVVDVHCKYKKELLSGDTFMAQCRVSELRSKTFTMEYRLINDPVIHAVGSTVNLCIDRQARKAARLPQAFIDAVRAYEGISEVS